MFQPASTSPAWVQKPGVGSGGDMCGWLIAVTEFPPVSIDVDNLVILWAIKLAGPVWLENFDLEIPLGAHENIANSTLK